MGKAVLNRGFAYELAFMRVVIYGPFVDHQIRLANAFPDDVQVHVLLPLPELSKMMTKVARRGVDIHIMRIGQRPRRSDVVFRLLESWKHIRAFHPDVVHVQLGGGWTELAILPFLLSYPMVVTFHDVELHPGDESVKARIVRSLFRKRADKIIVHGDFLRSLLAKRFSVPIEKTESIPLGAPELEVFKEFENSDVLEEGNMLLFFGRILEYKGLEYLIKAEPFISKEFPSARVVIAGAGDDFDKYQQMMVGREGSFIVLNRRISYEEAAQLFQKCSVVVLPYVEASQSGVVPIAYGFRKPVVVTQVGSIPEVVRDNETGLIVQPRDSRALAEAVIRLLRDRNLRREMGEKGHRLLETTLSWEEIGNRTLRVYENAITLRKK